MESPRRNLPTAGRRYIWRLIVSTPNYKATRPKTYPRRSSTSVVCSPLVSSAPQTIRALPVEELVLVLRRSSWPSRTLAFQPWTPSSTPVSSSQPGRLATPSCSCRHVRFTHSHSVATHQKFSRRARRMVFHTRLSSLVHSSAPWHTSTSRTPVQSSSTGSSTSPTPPDSSAGSAVQSSTSDSAKHARSKA